MDVENEKVSNYGGGTVCPECGLRQAHTHLGWLDHGEMVKRGRTIVKKTGGVLFTAIHCEKCGTNSLIIRFEKGSANTMWSRIQSVIWKLFGKELPNRGRITI